VDWNPSPPDKNMGLWREVYLTTSGPVALRHPAVLSKVDSPANNAAHLTVTALVKNASDRPVKGTLKGRIEDNGNIEFAQPVELAAGESKDVVFSPAQYPQLNLSNPRLWWPAQMGTPNLYDLQISFEVNGELSDV
jgi:exo-1,4-beta-D-glucosaminidase